MEKSTTAQYMGEASLADQSLARLQTIFTAREVKKGSFFIREGDPSTQMAYVEKGLFRSFSIDQNGIEKTKYFHPEGSCLFSYAAYLSGQESSYNICALEDSRILMGEIADFMKLTDQDMEIMRFYQSILNQMLIMKETHASSFTLLNNQERYRQFQEEYPGLEKRIKQHHLASYLGLTPVTLSRLRKKISLSNDNEFILK